MKHNLIVALCVISTMRADFLLQNNTGRNINVDVFSETWQELGTVTPRITQKITLHKPNFFQKAKIKFWAETEIDEHSEFGVTISAEILIKTENYWNLLKNAKAYLPTFVITEKRKGELVINGPTDEKTLAEVIQNLKKAALKPITKEISTVTNLPHQEGGIAGIAGEYCLEPE